MQDVCPENLVVGLCSLVVPAEVPQDPGLEEEGPEVGGVLQDAPLAVLGLSPPPLTWRARWRWPRW